VGKKNQHLLAPGQYVKISISDTGVGIPERHIRKIFDPYFTTKQRGNGLGLAICLSIVEKHGGHIEVESEEGKGTTFLVFLPAVEHMDDKVTEKKTPAKIQLRETGRLLVMDDDESLLSIIKSMLASIGYDVHGATDGLDIIRMYQEARKAGKPYDVLVLDLTVPAGMGAKETISRLKDMDPSVRAIVSSGYSNDNIMMYYKEFGFKGVIAKPYRLDELSMAVRKAMEE
jgi:two-component system, cell cycle sensor histidine kinase and response regulator CckA